MRAVSDFSILSEGTRRWSGKPGGLTAECLNLSPTDSLGWGNLCVKSVLCIAW